MRVLLAGGGGFIGSHLTDLLLARGDEVVALDSFVTGRPQNLAHCADHPALTVVEHDITLPLPAHPALRGPFDAVLHLASPASPDDFATMPLEILEVGSTGTRRLIERAEADGARFLLASTSEVYGDPLVHPQPETYWGNVSSTGPRSCYDEAKRYAEALTMAHHRVHGLQARIVRIFNTYGERMRPEDGRVINTFITQALQGLPITVHGDGGQTRSFCHVSDEVRGIAVVLDGPIGTPVNVGNPIEHSIRDVAELVIELTGSPSEIVSVPIPGERQGDPVRRCPDITIAREQLGWEPTVSLRDGLTSMIDFFRRHEHLGH